MSGGSGAGERRRGRRRRQRRVGVGRRPGVLLAFAAALLAVVCLEARSAMAYEEPAYAVLEEGPEDLELRRYEPYLVAETVVEADVEDAGGVGFRRLAGYIGGDNRRREPMERPAPATQEPASEKIEMTAPVTQRATDGRYRIAFVMPSEYTLETLPEPRDERIELRRVPARTLAAVTYSGTWSRSRYEKNVARLQEWMTDRGWSATGEPIWARYDPPFWPWFLRRNEILLPTDGP